MSSRLISGGLSPVPDVGVETGDGIGVSMSCIIVPLHKKRDGSDPPPKRMVIYSCPNPPSTLSSTPVMYDASSEARNATALAISSGSPKRFIGT